MDDSVIRVGQERKKVTSRAEVIPSTTPMIPPVMLIRIASVRNCNDGIRAYDVETILEGQLQQLFQRDLVLPYGALRRHEVILVRGQCRL